MKVLSEIVLDLWRVCGVKRLSDAGIRKGSDFLKNEAMPAVPAKHRLEHLMMVCEYEDGNKGKKRERILNGCA